MIRREPGTQTYHVILPSCGSSGKAVYQNVFPWRDRWLLIERKLNEMFGDACAHGVAACVYAVIRQASGTNQSLIAARSRLAKQGLTIPWLELVAGHMAVNLVDNVRDALDGLPVRITLCWLDSSVALYWIRGQGDYKQFVANRVQKSVVTKRWHGGTYPQQIIPLIWQVLEGTLKNRISGSMDQDGFRLKNFGQRMFETSR